MDQASFTQFKSFCWILSLVWVKTQHLAEAKIVWGAFDEGVARMDFLPNQRGLGFNRRCTALEPQCKMDSTIGIVTLFIEMHFFKFQWVILWDIIPYDWDCFHRNYSKTANHCTNPRSAFEDDLLYCLSVSLILETWESFFKFVSFIRNFNKRCKVVFFI